MSHPLFQVDAFTDRPFAGNPAAVCLLDEPGDPTWMQRVAYEMNLSETAFLFRLKLDAGNPCSFSRAARLAPELTKRFPLWSHFSSQIPVNGKDKSI